MFTVATTPQCVVLAIDRLRAARSELRSPYSAMKIADPKQTRRDSGASNIRTLPMSQQDPVLMPFVFARSANGKRAIRFGATVHGE